MADTNTRFHLINQLYFEFLSLFQFYRFVFLAGVAIRNTTNKKRLSLVTRALCNLQTQLLLIRHFDSHQIAINTNGKCVRPKNSIQGIHWKICCSFCVCVCSILKNLDADYRQKQPIRMNQCATILFYDQTKQSEYNPKPVKFVSLGSFFFHNEKIQSIENWKLEVFAVVFDAFAQTIGGEENSHRIEVEHVNGETLRWI